MTKPPFADNPELRQALSMAIDREVLVAAITGRGEAPAYSWVPPGIDNYEPVQLPYAELSQPERNAIAQSLYRKAGYSKDNPLRFELRYNTSDTQQRIALAVQAMWRKVLGAEAQTVNVEFQVLLDQMREREVTRVFRSSWFGDYNDANTFLAIMQSDSAANMPGYSNPEYDELMRSAGEQLDLDRRRLYLEEAERVLLADHAVIPLYFYVSKCDTRCADCWGRSRHYSWSSFSRFYWCMQRRADRLTTSGRCRLKSRQISRRHTTSMNRCPCSSCVTWAAWCRGISDRHTAIATTR
jgi:oligopeptide transport system substrate-binding protein